MGFKRGWAAYRSKKRKAPKASKKRTAKKARPMARTRRRARRAVRRFVKSRSHTVPIVDMVHGVYTLDGLTGNRASRTVSDGVGVLFGTTSTKVVENDVKESIDYVTRNPKDAVLGAAKNFTLLHFGRKALGWLGIPKSVKLFGKYRIQVR